MPLSRRTGRPKLPHRKTGPRLFCQNAAPHSEKLSLRLSGWVSYSAGCSAGSAAGCFSGSGCSADCSGCSADYSSGS